MAVLNTRYSGERFPGCAGLEEGTSSHGDVKHHLDPFSSVAKVLRASCFPQGTRHIEMGKKKEFSLLKLAPS